MNDQANDLSLEQVAEETKQCFRKDVENAIKLEKHAGMTVVRDLALGGTKGRYIEQLYKQAAEVVYASSAEGGAQAALAAIAQKLGKKATIFGPSRASPHPRQVEVMRFGGQFEGIRPGYLSVVQSRARDYAQKHGALLAPFGMDLPNAVDTIAETARSLKLKPDFIWCSAGSGILARGLRLAWPAAEMHIVEVGASVDVAGTIKHTFHKPYAWEAPSDWAPFSCCRNYEAKAYHEMRRWYDTRKPEGLTLFWSPMNAPTA